jgi:hypothetical protein
MRGITQFAESASGGVTFESVYDPPDGAYGFDVAWMFLQLEGLVVQRLQQFLGTLEKEFLQFRAAIIGKLGHAVTSIF